MSEDEPVYYYDSLDPQKPGVVINELTQMFAVGDEEVPCVIMSVQKQRGWKVCGVRAIVAGVLAMGGWSPQEISGLDYPRNTVMYKVMHGPKSHYNVHTDCSRYLFVLWWNIMCLSSFSQHAVAAGFNSQRELRQRRHMHCPLLGGHR